MPALLPTDFSAQITWLGVVPDRAVSLRAVPVERLEARFEGVLGETHSGLTRASCARVTRQYPKGTPIRNTRQLSIVSEEDLALTAAQMGLDQLDPALIGASIVIRGIPDFTHVPPSARLQGPAGTTLTIDMENRPCNWPGREIEAENPGAGGAYKTAARHRRGVTAWVEREGPLVLGDMLQLHIPDQPVWPHLARVRAG